MKKQLLIFLITLLYTQSYAQISFEKGYYINNNNEKIDCEIKNIDWNNNPKEFIFRLSESTAQETATIELVKEFGIYNYSKYLRSTVGIDRSSKDLADLSTERNPVFKEETLFLKVLMEGKASLYQFVEGNLVRFFYNASDSDTIQQLIFKSYKTSDNLIADNNGFRQQLINDLKCEYIKLDDIKKINY